MKLYSSKLLTDTAYKAGFSTRAQGDGMDPDVIHSTVAKVGNINRLITLKQVHGADVMVYKKTKHGQLHEMFYGFDGVVCTDSHVALAIRTADCVPIVFADKKKGIIGASHQGWKGTRLEMAKRMVEQFADLGSRISDITVSIGPAIGSCCYEVGEEVASNFQTGKIVKQGKWFLDLADINKQQLLVIGIPEKNIETVATCTKCNEAEFFSYRREGKKLAGEMFSFIVKQ